MSISSIIASKGTTCDVYTVATSQSSMGARGETKKRRIKDQPCFIWLLSGREKEIAGREGRDSTHKFAFEAGVTINSTDELRIGTEVYEDLFPQDINKMGHHTEVWARLRQ